MLVPNTNASFFDAFILFHRIVIYLKGFTLLCVIFFVVVVQPGILGEISCSIRESEKRFISHCILFAGRGPPLSRCRKIGQIVYYVA